MTTRKVEIDLIIGIIIAMKVRGIINCKSKNCGKFPPNKTPIKVEICQEKNKVIPVPRRWKWRKDVLGSFINLLIDIA